VYIDSSCPVLTIVYAFFAGSPSYITDEMQCVLNAAARLVTGTYKFDHGLSHLLHEELHWLDVPERIHYRLGVTVHAVCSTRPQSTWSTAVHQSQTFPCSRHHLRPVTRHHLTVPRYRLITFGRWAFSVAGPTVWNSLPDSLRDPALTSNSFTQSLKTNLFCRIHTAQ